MTQKYRSSNHGTMLGRRDFLSALVGGSAALMHGAPVWAEDVPLHCVPPLPSAAPVPFTPKADAPIRVRKSAFELSVDEQSKLKVAYAALRKATEQNPNDPRGWRNQALIHCWYCSGAGDAVTGIEIHGGWWFLPWHRAYLYFHEQILANLIGDPSFALPFWDWDTDGRNRVPDVYRTPNDPSNPLFDPTRKEGPNDRIPDFLVGKAEMKTVLDSKTFPEFGGGSDQSVGQAQMGSLEGAPHGGVHLWTTDPTINPNNAQTNMGVLATAAFDPIFFAHHANIDRLWDKWIKAPNANPPRGNPASDIWLGQSFVFYDQAPTWTFIAINQVVDHEGTLRYRYQDPQTAPGPAVVATVRPTGPRVAQLEVQPPGPPIIELTQTPGPKALTADPSTIQVTVPPPARESIRALEAAAPSQRRLILHIDGVELPADRGALLKVYLNQPNVTAASGADEAGYLGSIVVVPATTSAGGHVHGKVVRNFTFDVTDKLTSAPGGNENIAVTLVPSTGDGKKPSDVKVSYQRVYITSP